MLGFSQDIRFGPPDDKDINNPQRLYTATKPSRIIITDGVPEQEDGEILWYAIDQNTGVLYKKTEESGGQWQGIYQFAGGAGGITDGANLGTGFDVFKQKNGSILEFKTVVSQPQSSFESVVNIGEVGFNEINITGQKTAATISTSGNPTRDDNIVNFSFPDANGNLNYILKQIIGGTGILIQNVKYNPADPNPDAESFLRITNTQTPEQPSFINAYINGLTQTIPNSYVNFDTIWTQTEISSDWVKYTDNNNTWWRYIGTAGKKFKLSVDVYAQMGAIIGPTQDCIVALAVGLPPSQTIIPNTGILLEIPPDNTGQGQLFRCNGSLNFIAEPAVNDHYTMMAQYNSGASKSITFEQLRWAINKI